MGFGSNRGRLVAAWALLCITAVAQAAEGDAARGDPTRGQKKFYTCLGCHGTENYKNAYPSYRVPKLRHQHAAYIIAALTEYKNGERPHATMHAQAASMTDQDMLDIATYLQSAEPTKPTTTVLGTTPKQVETCAACHGINGSGVDAPLQPKPPVLAGQHPDYLEAALNSYRNGRRKNAVMGGMAASIQSEADVEAIAAYFSRQKSPLATAKHDEK